jgi:LysM repeat protein
MQYTIQKGDTLSDISKRFGVPIDDIMLNNSKIKDKNKIYAGDTIDIPVFFTPEMKSWWQWILDFFTFGK